MIDSNAILASKIMFTIGFIVYIIYGIILDKKEKLDSSLYNTIRTISNASIIGEAIESAVKRVSEMHHETSSRIFLFVLARINEGKSFAQSMRLASKRFNSDLLKPISMVLIEAEKSGAEVNKILNDYLKKVWKLKNYEKYAIESTKGNIHVLIIMCLFILPTVFYFYPSIMEEITIFPYSYYFFAGYGIILALYNYLIYDDHIGTLINIPLYASIPLLIPSAIEKLVMLFF